MSLRVLRKLQGDTNLIGNVQDENSDPEPDMVTSGGTRKKQLNVNRYDLLNHLSHSESEVKEDDDNEMELATGGTHNAGENGKDIPRRKKKKKKKKLVKSTSTNHKSSEDNLEVDEVERSVQEVNRILGETPAVGQSISSEDKGAALRKGILNIEHKHLNPNNELKRIFGSKIIQNEQKRRARGRTHVRSTWLVPARENWQQVGKQGVSMKLLENKGGILHFTYEHNFNYQQVQKQFLEAVESLNPDNVVAIINKHPYHVDALIQLSDMCKMSEDLQMAAELNERVLYCLECSFHPLLNLAQGNCRLDYRRQENRGLFIALFKHLMFVGQRACYRTALEFCKLLLSLDPDGDPVAAVLCVDFYALKAGQHAWLARAGEEWEGPKNLLQLPNFAYSLAVARFHLGEMETADRMLQDALLMFPGVLEPLLEKCAVQTDPRVAAHSYFAQAETRDRPALRQLCQLYVHRCYHVWKDSDLLPWLERNVHRAMDRVDASDPCVAEYRDKRQKRYHTTPRPILRHIILTDMKEVTATMTEDTDGPVLSFDPLPPLDAINIYVRPTRMRLHDRSNAFSMFFRSILPTFNINELVGPAGDQQIAGEVEEGAAGGPAVDLRRSVRTLLDAMTDLLSNIQPPEVPGADNADADADDDSDGGAQRP